MKKLILALFAVGSFTAAQAQSAGSILVYGNVGVSSAKDAAENKTMSWNFNPGVGYQFDEHFTVGLEGGYRSSGSKANTSGSVWVSDKAWQVGVFARYTMPVNHIFYFYPQLGVGYMNQHTSTDGKKDDKSDVNGFYASLFPAVGVNVHNGFALNFGFGGLGFTSMKADVPNAKAATSFDLSFGQQFNIGISKNFGGHKMHGHHEPMDDTRHMDTSDDDDTSSKKKKARKDDDE